MATLERIMFIDDEADIRTVASLALETLGGFKVETCDSGGSALDAATRFRPDLILLDVMMPELDGPATLARLQADPNTAAIPVIFFTAKTQKDELDSLRLPGAVGVLAKPFDPTRLAMEVEEIWSRHHDEK
jgi:CheY-like chemotaxis protein